MTRTVPSLAVPSSGDVPAAAVLELASALIPLAIRRPADSSGKPDVSVRMARIRSWTTGIVHSGASEPSIVAPVAGIARDAAVAATGAYAVVPVMRQRVWSAASAPSSNHSPAAESSDASNDGGYALVVELGEHHDWSVEELRGLETVGAMVARELRLRGEIAVARSIATREQAHRFQDTVTQLPNREVFVERLELAIHRAARHHDSRFAVLVLDVDGLDSIYQGRGRGTGDGLVRALAERLKLLLRTEDLLARSTSEGFLVLLDEVSDAVGASRVAVRIQRALAAPLVVEGEEVRVSASIGITLSAGRLESPDELIQAASLARARAREGHSGEFQIFEPAMQECVRRRLDLEAELRRAVECQEFEVFYQPLISLETGTITELEALVRWNHPTRGRVSAGEFIPLAEESGLILSIGNWVIATACRQVSEWRQMFRRNPPALTVNVAAKLLALGDFTHTIRNVLAASGLEPHALRLEITESILIGDPTAAHAKLAQLRAAGVSIYLDDFGAGYSSLRYLRDLPLDGIKLDRAFIEGITEYVAGRQPDVPIVRTVRQLAKDMGVRAIAEGIETPEQLLALREFGYDLAQGYHIARPLPISEMEKLLGRDGPPIGEPAHASGVVPEF